MMSSLVMSSMSDMIVTEFADQSISPQLNRECSQSEATGAYNSGIDLVTCRKASGSSSSKGSRCLASRVV